MCAQPIATSFHPQPAGNSPEYAWQSDSVWDIGHQIFVETQFRHLGFFRVLVNPRYIQPMEDSPMRLKPVTVGHPSRIRHLEPQPLPIHPATSEQLGSAREFWYFECNKN